MCEVAFNGRSPLVLYVPVNACFLLEVEELLLGLCCHGRIKFIAQSGDTSGAYPTTKVGGPVPSLLAWFEQLSRLLLAVC